MNWIQENKKLAAIVGVMVAGALGLGVWLYMSYATYSEAQTQFGELTGQIKSLEASPLYPNPDNVKAKSDKLDAFQDEVEKMRGVLLLLQQPIKPLSETEFQAKLKERALFVKQKATDAGVALPAADFALGFEEYSKTLPKSADSSAELSVHLDAMESIVTTFIKSGVKSVDFFDRAKLPSETGGAAAKVTAPAPAARPNSSNKKGQRAAVDPVKAAEPVLDKYTVKVILTTDQLPLQKVMNTLSDFDPKVMPYFTVVRLMRIENTSPEGPIKSEVKVQPNQPIQQGIDPGKKIDPTVIPTPQPAPADAAVIMGEELLKVYMEIDYIRFRAADSSAADSSAKK
jgi:hypothetical protein